MPNLRPPNTRKPLLFLALLLFWQNPVQGLPETVCLYTEQAPVIDGRGDEPLWQGAEPLHLLDVVEGVEHPHTTQVRLRWDQQALYILFTAADPDVWSTLAQRDAPLYDEEIIELMLDPDGDGRNYAEIEINSVNTLFDMLIPGDGSPGLATWNPDITSAVAVTGSPNQPGDTDQSWSVELALPWAALRTPLLDVPGLQPLPPRIGDSWRCNFYRYERLRDQGVANGTIQYSAWSPTGAVNFHVPERFGQVVFGRLDDEGQIVRTLDEAEVPPGSFQLTPSANLLLAPVPLQVADVFKDQLDDDFTLNLPPGFKANVFALTGLQRPRLMAFSPDGVLHVADMRGGRTSDSKQSRIVALPDADGDGVADRAIVAADQLSYANSLAFFRGDLYVAETHQVVRLRDFDGDYVYEEREVFIADIPAIPGNGFHGTRTLVFDEINEKVYLSVGSPCDLCRQDQPVAGTSDEALDQRPEWGTVLEFNTDGSGRRVFAHGIRNMVGMDLHPLTNQLWGTHNHYDLGGPSLPPEWIDIVRDGGFYGYPFVFGYQAWVDFAVPDYQKMRPITRDDSLLVQTQTRPAALVPAHLAPIGIHFYDAPLFPPQYRHAAFVALRGGQAPGNLAVVPGFKVVALFSQPDGTQATVADFLTGFNRAGRAWAKPVGLTTDALGRLYVSSDVGATAIFRIEPTIIQGSWQHQLPLGAASGQILDIAAVVHIERFDPQGAPPLVTADLSALGGPSAHPLEAIGGDQYRLQTTLPVERPNGEVEVIVWIRQQNEAGLHSVRLAHTITVAPGEDAVIFADAVNQDWSLVPSNRVQPQPLAWDGAQALALTTTPTRLAGWNLEFKVDRPFSGEGYKSLRFAFHPGALDPSAEGIFQVRINERSVGNRPPTGRYVLDQEHGQLVNLVGGGVGGTGGYEVDLSHRNWQQVEIPLAILQPEGAIELVRFSGNLGGTFYLSDIRLLTAAQANTAIAAPHRPNETLAFSLEQNRPNPFNNETTLPYLLSFPNKVNLAIYNLAGQQVAQLLSAWQPAGLHTAVWDGDNDRGQPLGSGVYLYRLQAGDQIAVRKLLLLK